MTAVQVIGAGGHARVAIATLRDGGHAVTGVWDDDPSRHGATCLDAPILGPVSAATPDVPTIIAVGDNRTRARLAGSLSLTWFTAIHPRAYVHPSAIVGAGTVIFAGAIVQPQARIGAHAIINTAATVDHDCQLGAFVHLGPGVHLCGDVTVEEGALLGVASAARPGAHVGAWAIVGAGAVVVAPVPAGDMVIGVPATSRSRGPR